MDKAVFNELLNKNCLVTGGTGLIGREVTSLLVKAGANVRVVSLDKIKLHDKVDYVYGDLTDFKFCKEQTVDMDCVFHLAGIKGSVKVTESNPASFLVPLLMFNTNVLEASRLNKVPKLVYTSSIGAYSSAEVFKESDTFEGAPMDKFPGWAKRMAELQIQAYKLQYGLNDYSVVRPCNVYGPGDNFDPENAMVIPTLMHRIANKEDPVLVWGDGSAIRDFAYSRDVAEGIILTMIKGLSGRPFINLGSGQGYTIKTLLESLNSFIDFNYQFDTSKPSGFPKRIMDISLAKELIDYRPSTSLIDGLKETWDWYIANKNEYKSKKNYFNEDL